MLPDFPSLKKEIHRLLVVGARIERPRAVLLEAVQERPMREGDRVVLVYETGEEEEISLNAYAAEDVVNLTEVKRLILDETYNRYRDLISQMDQEAAADVENLQDRKAESVGNVVDLRGAASAGGCPGGCREVALAQRSPGL
jgi:hypothetical protein